MADCWTPRYRSRRSSRWPKLNVPTFHALGVSAANLRAELESKDFRGLVVANEFDGLGSLRVSVPLRGQLKVGQVYTFKVEAPACRDVVLVVNGRMFPLIRQGTTFVHQVVLPPGDLRLDARGLNDTVFRVMLRYKVE